MKFVEKVIFNRRRIDGMGNRYRVFLTLTEWDVSETELYVLLEGALGVPRVYLQGEGDGGDYKWLIYIYASDELDAAMRVSRALAQLEGKLDEVRS